MKSPKRKIRSAALRESYNQHIAGDPKRIDEFEVEVLNAEIAAKIFQLRTRAGLSQRALAKKVGTTASANCRLEDASRKPSRTGPGRVAHERDSPPALSQRFFGLLLAFAFFAGAASFGFGKITLCTGITSGGRIVIPSC